MRVFAICVLAALPGFCAAHRTSDPVKHINAAADVFEEINAMPDKGIPRDILDKARCIGIVPSLKHGGFIVGAKYGKGLIVCRDRHIASGWSGPAFIRIEGGSFGFQIGAGETDLVFVVMNQDGMNKLMEDKFEIGGEAGAMAGPVGREASAQTDAMMHAEILSWSRARGIFAGIALTGSTLRPDHADNDSYYGREDISQREILTGRVRPPRSARVLTAVLRKYVPGMKRTRT